MNDSFLFYRSWLENIQEEYGDIETQQKLIFAIIQYGITGIKIFPCEKLFLKQVYFQIDSAKSKWEDIRQKRSEAGRKGGLKGKGGAPKGNQNARKDKTKANNSKQNHNDNENDNVNDNENDNVNEHYNNTSSVDSLNAITSEVEDDDDVWGEGYGEPV